MLVKSANSIAESIMRSTKATPRGSHDMLRSALSKPGKSEYFFENRRKDEDFCVCIQKAKTGKNTEMWTAAMFWGLYEVAVVAAHAGGRH